MGWGKHWYALKEPQPDEGDALDDTVAAEPEEAL